MSKKVHVALASNDIVKAVEDYTQRLGCKPEVVVPGVYALWRTDVLNLSVRQDSACKPGELRHLGFEDDASEKFSEERDCHGIVWERFTAEQQRDEIRAAWPDIGTD